jgi:hypothetical protein
MTDEEVWTLEERLWLEGAGVYENVLDPACLMAFPGVGVLRAADILDGVKTAPRWTSVAMTNRALGRAGESVIVVGYTAEGHRPGAEPYRCFCTSTYRRDAGRWKIVQHQQTIAG